MLATAGAARTPERCYRHRAWTLGKLVLTTVYQAGAAPIVDLAWTEDKDGRRYRSRAILLSQWFCRQWDREPGLALVVGWRDWP
jgi:hypothetical protein